MMTNDTIPPSSTNLTNILLRKIRRRRWLNENLVIME